MPTLYLHLREMHAAGVKILAGTDAGVVLMFPGFSLHDEVAILLRDVGFSPVEALRTATANVAAFYGQEWQFGAIEPGQAADLVLLDDSPLKDIRNTPAGSTASHSISFSQTQKK